MKKKGIEMERERGRKEMSRKGSGKKKSMKGRDVRNYSEEERK